MLVFVFFLLEEFVEGNKPILICFTFKTTGAAILDSTMFDLTIVAHLTFESALGVFHLEGE